MVRPYKKALIRRLFIQFYSSENVFFFIHDFLKSCGDFVGFFVTVYRGEVTNQVYFYNLMDGVWSPSMAMEQKLLLVVLDLSLFLLEVLHLNRFPHRMVVQEGIGPLRFRWILQVEGSALE